MLLNASNSFISNVPFQEARRNLTYTWTCNEIFAKFCVNSTSPILNIDWLEVYNLPNMSYNEIFSFKVQIDWVDGGKIMGSATLQESI